MPRLASVTRFDNLLDSPLFVDDLRSRVLELASEYRMFRTYATLM